MTVKREAKAADITQDEADKLRLHNHHPTTMKIKPREKVKK